MQGSSPRNVSILLVFLALTYSQLAGAFRVKMDSMEKHVSDLAAESNAAALAELGENTTSTFKNQPLVYNKCNLPLAVYLERGFLFNKQVIQPGEAAQLWSPDWGPHYAPYNIIAIVGDESALPTEMESLLHFIGKAAVPTAFVGGVVVSVISWGALTGPALALGPLVSNAPMIAGYTLGAVDIAAGAAASHAAEKAAEHIVQQHPAAFMAKKKWVFPGINYFEVVGGPSSETGENPPQLEIKGISAGQFAAYNVETVKVCQALSTRGQIGTHAFTLDGAGDPQVNGRWRVGPYHNDRPSYIPYSDANLIIQFSGKRKVWRITTITDPGLWSRTTYYESPANTEAVPDYGWRTVDGSGNAPNLTLAVAFTIKNCGDSRLNGDWAHAGEHNDKPQYWLINGDEDDEIVIQYSWKRGVWRATTVGGWWRTTLYSVSSNAEDIPKSGWEAVDGNGPAPEFEM